jgi:uncharacterized protein YegL
MSSTLGLTVLPEYESLAYDERQGSFVVLLRPPMAPQTRPPLRLVLAIDVSGSMLGDKLTTALASAQAILNALSPADTFACVTFNGKAQVLLPMTTMNAQGKQLAAQALRAAQARGNTNLGDAILSSFELCGGRGRALLLTDGCPTEGVTSPDQLAQLTRSTARGATLSTFGFGRDVNPLLLSSLSEQGSGNYTFIEAGEPPIEAIAAEVGGLLMTTAANLRLLFRPSPGVTIDQVFRASDVQLHDGAVSLGLAALVARRPSAAPSPPSRRRPTTSPRGSSSPPRRSSSLASPRPAAPSAPTPPGSSSSAAPRWRSAAPATPPVAPAPSWPAR